MGWLGAVAIATGNRTEVALDNDKEIYSLAGETLALQIIVGSVLGRLCEVSPALAEAITKGFDDASSCAESVAIKFGQSASPDHSIKALRVIEELRAVVVRDQKKPRHGV